jgi:hypothetical protein
MLYIIQILIMLVIVGWLLKTERINWNSFWTIYSIALITVDIIEIFINIIFNLYKFPANLFTNSEKDNFMGIILADSVILPLTAIVFCYIAKSQPWKASINFTILYTFLEWIYLKLGYLQYYGWKLYYSALAYVIGFSIFAPVATKLIDKPNKIPYFVRLSTFAYLVLVIPGAIPDVLLHLHHWRPGIFSDFWSDDRVADLGSCLVISVIIGIIIPRTRKEYKLSVFIVLSLLTVLFGFISYWKGWLVYVKWNHLLTFVRYTLPYIILYWYDKWQVKILMEEQIK